MALASIYFLSPPDSDKELASDSAISIATRCAWPFWYHAVSSGKYVLPSYTITPIMDGRSFCLTFKLRVQQQNRVTAFGADKLIYATAGRLMRETGSRWGGDPRAFEINGVKGFRTCKALLEQSIPVRNTINFRLLTHLWRSLSLAQLTICASGRPISHGPPRSSLHLIEYHWMTCRSLDDLRQYLPLTLQVMATDA